MRWLWVIWIVRFKDGLISLVFIWPLKGYLPDRFEASIVFKWFQMLCGQVASVSARTRSGGFALCQYLVVWCPASCMDPQQPVFSLMKRFCPCLSLLPLPVGILCLCLDKLHKDYKSCWAFCIVSFSSELKICFVWCVKLHIFCMNSILSCWTGHLKQLFIHLQYVLCFH